MNRIEFNRVFGRSVVTLFFGAVLASCGEVEVQKKAETSAGPFSSVTGGCVRDNTSGLMWEIKTADGGLRDWNKTYSNYDSTLSVQKYDSVNFVFVAPTQVDIDASSNSVSFQNVVNATNLCGFSDWRLPTLEELQSIVKPDQVPTIDATWFPNTHTSGYWSASPVAGFSGSAWFVNFDDKAALNSFRDLRMHVRLVRAGQ